jgi:hypothetical protein
MLQVGAQLAVRLTASLWLTCNEDAHPLEPFPGWLSTHAPITPWLSPTRGTCCRPDKPCVPGVPWLDRRGTAVDERVSGSRKDGTPCNHALERCDDFQQVQRKGSSRTPGPRRPWASHSCCAPHISSACLKAFEVAPSDRDRKRGLAGWRAQRPAHRRSVAIGINRTSQCCVEYGGFCKIAGSCSITPAQGAAG